MYKFLLLFLLFAAVNSYRCHKEGPCRHKHRLYKPTRYNNRHSEKVFQDLSRSVINTDRWYQAVCNNCTDKQIREYYGLDLYTLKYSLPKYSIENVTIKVQHRVIYLKAQKSNVLFFKDIKILPRIVDAKNGQYFKQDNDLIIQFAYKTNPKTEYVVTCSDDINEDIQKLNKIEVGERELRSLDDSNNDQVAYSDDVTINTN